MFIQQALLAKFHELFGLKVLRLLLLIPEQLTRLTPAADIPLSKNIFTDIPLVHNFWVFGASNHIFCHCHISFPIGWIHLRVYFYKHREQKKSSPINSSKKGVQALSWETLTFSIFWTFHLSPGPLGSYLFYISRQIQMTLPIILTASASSRLSMIGR